MDAFDRFAIEAVIRSRVGKIDRIDLVERTHPTPMRVAVETAERRIGRSITLFWIDDGLPGHFTLTSRKDLPIVFHGRQIEWTAYLRSLYTNHAFHSLTTPLAEKFCLRLLANLLLTRGFVDQSLQVLARSSSPVDGVEIRFPKIIPDLEYMPKNETYVAVWFHGFAHEAGHHLDPSRRGMLEAQPFLTISHIENLIADLIRHLYPDRGSRDALMRIIASAAGDPRRGCFASAALVRHEAIADIVAGLILLDTATAIFSALGKEPPDRQLLWYEILIQMSCLMIIQQCNVMASWFTTAADEVEQQNLAFSNVALQARTNLFLAACTSPSADGLLPDFSTPIAGELPEGPLIHLSGISRHIEAGVQKERARPCSKLMKFFGCCSSPRWMSR